MSALTAQPVCEIREFSVNDGLAQSIVTGILQDQKGLLWMSTWNGINKFDGYTFRNYKTSSQSEYAQTNNRITFMAETIDGNIWCQSYDSKAYIFDCRQERFIDVLKPFEAEIQKELLVRNIYSFSNGIAWIVCEDGYCFRVDETRYDQKEGMVIYNAFNGHLKGNQIVTIYQDSQKDEWILTDKGVTIVGGKQLNNDFPFKYIHEHKSEIYLVSTSDKLAVYVPETKNFRFVEIPYPVSFIHSIRTLKKDLLALTTDNGLVLYSPEENTFRQIDIRTPTQTSNYVLSVYEDREGEWWMFSKSPGVIRFNLETGEKQHLFTPEKEVVNYGRDSRNLIFEDNQGTLWVLPSKGNLEYFDRQTKQLKTFYTDPDNPHSAFTPLVRYFHLDRQGNVWLIGARGIKKMSFYPQTFNLIPQDDKGTEVRAFFLDRSHCFWVASKSGYIRIYHPDGSLKGYLTPQGKMTPTPTKFHANVYCFHQDQEGVIWLGTKGNGLFQLKKSHTEAFSIRNFRHTDSELYSLSTNDVYSIFTDSQGNTWIGCYGGGLNLMKEETNGTVRFVHYKNELKNFPTEGFLNVRTIAETRDSILLVGTTSGIVTFSNRFTQPEEVMFYQNKFNVGDPSNLIGRDVLHIYTDSRGDTYVLTFTGGVNKIISRDLLTNYLQYRPYTPADGLASDLVLSMIEDDSGQLWIVSENALSRFDPQNESFDTYDKMFLRYDFSFTEAIPTFNGRRQLVFGTDLGMLEIAPEQLRKSDYVPPIVFTDLRIHGKQSPEPVNDLDKLSLSPSQRNITLHFSALDYINPEEIRYAYRLKGLEKEWNMSGKNRTASYINLPAGDYQLEVKSTNSDGVWVDNLRTLSIKVHPKFRETLWAWLLYLLLFIVFTFCIVYILFYIYRLRHEVSIEQEVSNLKLRFFTDISHELRTPLTLITSPVTEILEHESLSPVARKQLNLVHKNTERMLRLINQILDFRKIQNQKMKILAEKTELTGFIGKVSESFNALAAEKGIDYSFRSDVEELYIWIDRDKVEKIVFNLLSNAFKYTLHGKAICIRLKVKEDCACISVEDEGIGIAPDRLKSLFKRFETLAKNNIMQPSSGIGLSLVKELVEMHHGHIEVESQPEKGSIFRVSLPLDKAVLEKDDQVEFILSDLSGEKATAVSSVASEEEPAKEPEKNTDGKPTLLIVEDNRELKELLRTILDENYHIIEASNGKEGLEKVLEVLPDMIISDVMMPVMDGLEMIRQIKENKEVCHTPIIVLSARSSLDDRIEGLEQGIDDYITKPFSASYLRARITSLFARRKQLQELFMSKLSGKKSFDPDQLQPARPQIMPYDEMFIKQVMDFMEEQMDNPELFIDDFANKLSMSRSLFYRKLKSFTGYSPMDFIREIRFKRAIQLMENGTYNFSEIAYMTGFRDPKYFSKSFKKYMGVTPSEYKENNIRKPTGERFCNNQTENDSTPV